MLVKLLTGFSNISIDLSFGTILCPPATEHIFSYSTNHQTPIQVKPHTSCISEHVCLLSDDPFIF